MMTKHNKHVLNAAVIGPTRGSLSPETILSVKGSDSLPAPKPSSAIVPSVGGSELIWVLLSSSNVSFLTGVKSVATPSPDSTQRKGTYLFVFAKYWQIPAPTSAWLCSCLVVPTKINHL